MKTMPVDKEYIDEISAVIRKELERMLERQGEALCEFVERVLRHVDSIQVVLKDGVELEEDQ